MKDLQIGDILFLDSGSIFNKITKVISRFRYGHVALVVEGQLVVDIKAGQRMKVIPLKELKVEKFTVKRMKIPLDDKQSRNMVKYTKNILINPPKYDYMSIFRLMLKYSGFKTSRKSYDIKRLYCSEFVDYIYSKTGIDLLKEQYSLVGIDDLFNSEKLETVFEGFGLNDLLETPRKEEV